MTSEIVEIEDDDGKSISDSESEQVSDVYVAVGKNDLHVVKWALDHAVTPGARVFLVHVFPPVTYIQTPAGRLSKSRLSEEQVRVYVNEESNKRRNLLERYIRLCTDAKVVVDTMLLESNAKAKAILDLIPVANITRLVIGTKRTRLFGWRHSTGEYVQKNVPDFCKVYLVYDSKTLMDRQVHEVTETVSSTLSSNQRLEISRFSKCTCFSGKFR